MNGDELAFFDTNILVYAHDAKDKHKREVAKTLILEGLKKGTGVISAQVLSEFYVTLTKKIAHPLSSDEIRKEMFLLSRLKTVALDTALVLKAVDNKKAWRISYWDALILTAAEHAHCKIVWSEDLSPGQNYGSVQVFNPFKRRGLPLE